MSAVDREQQRLRRRARDLVRKALKSGKLQRQPCEVCGDLKVEGHHDDYDAKPLDVRWLCRKHHNMTHHPISSEESQRLIELKQIVERGLATFIEVGEALMEIRDSRLYRVEHKTFEDYCREKWKMSDRRARQLIPGRIGRMELSASNC